MRLRWSAPDTDRVDVVEGSVAVAGRVIEYCRYNMDAPRRALFQYGTPGTRRLPGHSIDAARKADYDLLVFDRPGYAATSRRPGRRVEDACRPIVHVQGTKSCTPRDVMV